VAEQGFGLPIDQHDATALIDDHDGVGRRLDQAPEFLFGGPGLCQFVGWLKVAEDCLVDCGKIIHDLPSSFSKASTTFWNSARFASFMSLSTRWASRIVCAMSVSE